MRYVPAWFFILGAPLLGASQSTAIKLTIRTVMWGSSNEQIVYLQSDRKRVEYRKVAGRRSADGSTQPVTGPRIATITRCDLGQGFELKLDAKTYSSALYPPKPFTDAEMKARGIPEPQAPTSSKPTLRIETTTVDTGERKQMFGYTARHVIITRKQMPLAGSHLQSQVSITDGWFIDLHQGLSCNQLRQAAGGGGVWLAAVTGQPMDVPEFVDHGKQETGYPVQEVVTTKSELTLPDGTRKQFESRFESVVTIEDVRVAPSLFDVPAGFKHVKEIERNPSVSLGWPSSLWQRVKRVLTAPLSL
jgi:hypothetical protein